MRPPSSGSAHHARQRARHLDDGEVGVAAEGVLAREPHDEIQALVLDARERARRIQAQRREHGFDLALEVLLEPLGGAVVPRVPRQQLDSLLLERGQQDVVEAGVLRVHQPARPLVDGVELLGDREPVRARLVGTEFDSLLQAGDADLEELVQVVRRDAQEAQPLEQRHVLVERLREHALVELEQRQLAVDVVIGGTEVGLVHGSARV